MSICRALLTIHTARDQKGGGRLDYPQSAGLRGESICRIHRTIHTPRDPKGGGRTIGRLRHATRMVHRTIHTPRDVRGGGRLLGDRGRRPGMRVTAVLLCSVSRTHNEVQTAVPGGRQPLELL